MWAGFERGRYITVARFALTEPGHVPQRPRERIEVAGWTVKVASTDHHAITAVRLRQTGGRRSSTGEAEHGGGRMPGTVG